MLTYLNTYYFNSVFIFSPFFLELPFFTKDFFLFNSTFSLDILFPLFLFILVFSIILCIGFLFSTKFFNYSVVPVHQIITLLYCVFFFFFCVFLMVSQNLELKDNILDSINGLEFVFRSYFLPINYMVEVPIIYRVQFEERWASHLALHFFKIFSVEFLEYFGDKCDMDIMISEEEYDYDDVGLWFDQLDYLTFAYYQPIILDEAVVLPLFSNSHFFYWLWLADLEFNDFQDYKYFFKKVVHSNPSVQNYFEHLKVSIDREHWKDWISPTGDFGLLKYEKLSTKDFFAPLSLMHVVNTINSSKLLSFLADNSISSPFSTKFFLYVPQWNWKQFLGFSFDSLSLIFICLTTFIIFLCVCVCWYSYNYLNQQTILYLLLATQFFIILAFLTLDLILFYIFFESILIPLFFLVGMFGSRERRIRAAYYLMFYTLFGSLPFLLGILYIWNKTGLTNILLLEPFLYGTFSSKELTLLWFLFLPGFAFKIPLYPFHLWLPEAHVEAPTVGSVILAGLVLKLGGYGFIRFSVGLFFWGGFEYFNIVYWFCLFSMFCAVLCAACQFDLKRIIAYGSIAHMALVTFCIFLGLQVGFDSALLMMVGHGIVSSALFVLVGSIYERFHSRNVRYYGGLYKLLPRFGLFFLLFILFDISIPTSPGFFAEFLALIGITQQSLFFAVLVSLQIVIAVGVNLLLCARVLYGLSEIRYFSSFNILVNNFVYWCLLQKQNVLNVNISYLPIKTIHLEFQKFDLCKNEYFSLFLFFISAFIIGCFPSLILSTSLFDFELVLRFLNF